MTYELLAIFKNGARVIEKFDTCAEAVEMHMGWLVNPPIPMEGESLRVVDHRRDVTDAIAKGCAVACMRRSRREGLPSQADKSYGN